MSRTRNQRVADVPADDTNQSDDATQPVEPDVADVPVIQPAWSADAYRSGDQKIKGKIRSDLKKAFKAAVAKGDLPAAQLLMVHEESLTSSKSEKPEVSVEVTVAQRVADLRLAADLLESGAVRPEGISSVNVVGLAELVAGRYVPGNADAATKIATAKITKSGPQHNVADVIAHAFTSVPSGTFLTVAQIASASDYPHQGAVAARLFPAKGVCTVEGITPGRRDDSDPTTPKGARKV